MKPESLSQLTISANFAISADGKISSCDHRPSGWTSTADHQRLLALRRGADALFVGHRTLVTDDMSLTVTDQTQQPLRCIASSSGAVSGNEKIFHTAGGAIHIWCQTMPEIKPAHATIHRGSLTDFLLHLHTMCDVKHLHCEGGGTLLRMLLEIDCLDELHLTWAGHTLFLGDKAPTITGIPGLPMPRSQHFALTHVEAQPETGEVFLSYCKANA